MNYLNIIKYDVGNAPGLSVVLFVAGCRHDELEKGHCEECHNKVSWDFKAGKAFTEKAFEEIKEALKPSMVKNFVVSGGEPLHERNIEKVGSIIKKIKEVLPEKKIWIYTGYVMENLIKREDFISFILPYVDYVIDGPYFKDYATKNLQYRGSSNQRIYNIVNKEIFDITISFYENQDF